MTSQKRIRNTFFSAFILASFSLLDLCLGAPCVTGTYSATGQDTPSACIQCPGGTNSASGSTTCSAPIAGLVPCGLYAKGGAAVLCPPDHFCPS
jgi:hypothetical protein